MRQVVFLEPGRLEWQEAPDPQLQGPGEAIVRPIAAARCDLDRALALRPVPGAPFRGPFPFGHDCVAEVVELGEDVTGFQTGQRVVVNYHINCGECGRCRRGLTANCQSVPRGAMYGLGAASGDYGGVLADLVRVPFANGMLTALPDGVDPAAAVGASDNICDGWRTVGPYLEEQAGVPVLIVGGGSPSIGLYAAAVASALGASQIDYVDRSKKRLELAESLGANVIEGPAPQRLGPYPITVDASVDPAGLACALKSVEPGGVCTSVGIYYAEDPPTPLLNMFITDVTFKTGRAHSGPHVPKVLELIESGRLQPERLTTRLAAWDDAPEAFADPSSKAVVVR